MNKALEGIMVLDFSQLLAGPFAGMMLGDLGADIIKIERVDTGDIFRDITLLNSWVGGTESTCFMAWNRNKRSIAMDIKNEKIKKIIYKMVKKADVVIENFRPGVMDRLGYGYEKLKSINPKIVYASNSGFGSSGPYLNNPGQDMLVQGIVGLPSLTGRSDTEPMPIGTGLPDMLSSFHLIYGILAALLFVHQTGKGQLVQADLMRSTLALESQEFMTLLNTDKDFNRPKSGIGHSFQQAPFGIYKCLDGYISIAMTNLKILIDILKAPELLKYDNRDDLYEKRDEIYYKIQEIIKTNTVDYWLEKMLKKDLWVARVNDFRDVENDPQVKHMNAITNFHHKKAGNIRCISPAITLSETPPQIKLSPPLIGEHTTEILMEFGLEKNTIEELYEEGAVSTQK